MGKRANGEGNVRQRSNGRWEGRISYVDPVTDRRRSVSVYGATAAECRKELRKVRKRIEDGQPAKDAPDTVASWLKQWRESSLAASDRKATTKSLYGSLSRKHLEGTAIDNRQDQMQHGTHHQIQKVHCPSGHPYDEQNTLYNKQGHRLCRACNKQRCSEGHQRRMRKAMGASNV